MLLKHKVLLDISLLLLLVTGIMKLVLANSGLEQKNWANNIVLFCSIVIKMRHVNLIWSINTTLFHKSL